MTAGLHFATRTFSGGIADLGFTVQLPGDWIAHDVPKGEQDLSDPTVLAPLAVVTAPHAAIRVSRRTRPAAQRRPSDGVTADT